MVLLGIQRKEGQEGPNPRASFERGCSRLARCVEPTVSVIDPIEAPGPLLRGLLGENPGGIGDVKGGAVGVGMLLAEDLAEGTLHRLVLFHAAAGHAGTGEGPSLGRPALPGTEPRTVSPGTLPAHVPGSPPRPRDGRQVVRASPLAWKCELPGQVRGCGGARPRPAAAQLPRPHSCPPPSQQAIVGTAQWAGDLAGPTPGGRAVPLPGSPPGPPPPPPAPRQRRKRQVPYFQGGS